jgi:hypothetical protein
VKRGSKFGGSLLLLIGLGATAQVRLPELDFPSANGKHERPMKVKSIRGILVDENDAVIPNPQVEIRRLTGDKVIEVAKNATDSVGRFQVDVPKGKYQGLFRANGFGQKIVPAKTSRIRMAGF